MHPQNKGIALGGGVVAVFDLWLKCERGSNNGSPLHASRENDALGDAFSQLLCISCSRFLLKLPEKCSDPAPLKRCMFYLVWLQHSFKSGELFSISCGVKYKRQTRLPKVAHCKAVMTRAGSHSHILSNVWEMQAMKLNSNQLFKRGTAESPAFIHTFRRLTMDVCAVCAAQASHLWFSAPSKHL